MLQHLSAHPLKLSRVVVVGAHGFVGRAILRRLERDGVSVLGLARQDVDLLAEDAADRLTALLRPDDSVVAAAAMVPCKNGDMLRDNVTLALSLARACARASVAHVVNLSSDAVYADSASPLTESSPMAPDTLHGVMHLARELIFKAEIKSPLAILRPSLIYGAGDPHNGYGPNRFRRLAAQGQPIALFGEGEERRDHVLIDDVAEFAARVVYRRSVGALNIATGVVTSFRDIAEAVVKLSGNRVPIVSSPRQGPMPHNGYRPFDIAACRAAFPDFAYVPLLQGLENVQRAEPK